MPYPSVTNSFTNGTTAVASEVNTNFTDLINALSDGTKDIAIAALSCAGNVNLNGNTTLGNASGDDVTVTGSLASSIPIKTTYSYDIGSATLGLKKVYFGSDDSAARTIYLEAGTPGSSYGLKLPDADGAAKDFLQTDGSGQLSFVGGPATTAKTTTFNLATSEKVVLCSTSGGAYTATLYASSGNAGRTVKFIKTTSDLNALTIDGNGSETISGESQIYISAQYEWVELLCDGTNWYEIDRGPRYIGFVYDQKASGNDGGTASADTVHTRVLQTTSGDFSKFGSLSSNQITLAVGKYKISAKVPAYVIERHQAFLYSVTASAYIKEGTSEFAGDTSSPVTTHSRVDHILTITSQTTYEIRHYTINGRASDGLGVDSDGTNNPNTNNIYTTVEITKLG